MTSSISFYVDWRLVSRIGAVAFWVLSNRAMFSRMLRVAMLTVFIVAFRTWVGLLPLGMRAFRVLLRHSI